MAGYVVVRQDGRPILEHVVIATLALGKPMPDSADVHHVNRDKKDNRNGNLVICPDRAYHMLLHVRQRVIDAGGDPNTQRICRTCGQLKGFAEFFRTQCRTCGFNYRQGRHDIMMTRQRAARALLPKRSRRKLSVDDVLAIRASSEPSSVLGRRYGVRGCTVANIRAGRIWKPAAVEALRAKKAAA